MGLPEAAGDAGSAEPPQPHDVAKFAHAPIVRSRCRDVPSLALPNYLTDRGLSGTCPLSNASRCGIVPDVSDLPSDFSSSFRWPTKAGPYTVTVHFDEIDGRPECVGLEMWGKSTTTGGSVARFAPGGGSVESPVTPLTAEALRSVPLGRLVAEARRRQAGLADRLSRLGGAAGASGERSKEVWAPRATRRRPIYDAAHWREVARIYNEAWQAGDDPTSAVARHYYVSKSAAAKWVAKARNQMGLIPKTEKGRSRGATPEATR